MYDDIIAYARNDDNTRLYEAYYTISAGMYAFKGDLGATHLDLIRTDRPTARILIEIFLWTKAAELLNLYNEATGNQGDAWQPSLVRNLQADDNSADMLSDLCRQHHVGIGWMWKVLTFIVETYPYNLSDSRLEEELEQYRSRHNLPVFSHKLEVFLHQTRGTLSFEGLVYRKARLTDGSAFLVFSIMDAE